MVESSTGYWDSLMMAFMPLSRELFGAEKPPPPEVNSEGSRIIDRIWTSFLRDRWLLYSQLTLCTVALSYYLIRDINYLMRYLSHRLTYQYYRQVS